jgi:excisionase family DNA binding protein
LSLSPPQDETERKTQRRKDTAQHRRRDRAIRNERDAAINNPAAARIRPVGISKKDFAIATGVSPATSARWIAAGKIRSVKIGGKRLIAYEEVERIRNGGD